MSLNIKKEVTTYLKLTFTWSSVAIDCSSIAYITTFDCGYCPNTTASAKAVCYSTDIVIGSECTFTIQTEVCNSLTGNITTIHLKLQGKSLPI